MKVVISGASGFVGTHLSNFLSNNGYEVWKLTRRSPVQKREIFWDPYSKVIEVEKLDKTDVIINLSGENIANGLWTKKRKEILVNSRLIPSKFLIEVINNMDSKPQFYFATSAVGIYGPIAPNVQDETHPEGTGFLADLCREWEKTVKPLEQTNVKIIVMRFGIVFGKGGGMLEKLLKVYRWYLGGTVGDKDAYISWIAIEDLCSAIHFLINKKQIIGGAYNFVSPSPITQEEITNAISKAIGKPAIFRVPSFLIKIFLGEMGRELMLANQKIYPKKLVQEGYVFKFREFSNYLKNILK